MTETIAEVAVRDADARTREIYQKIMAATGVGSPALIYRHFAVFPDFLDWVWELIGPELESGRLGGHALSAVARTPVVALPHTSTADLARLGVAPDGQRLIRAMLATYNRMNPINLSLISAIRDLVVDPAGTHATGSHPPLGDAPAVSAPHEIIDLPPPVNLSDMRPALRDMVLELSAAIPSPGAQVIPTLYRHLAIWPDLMAHLAPGIGAAIERGDVQDAMDTLGHEMAPLIFDVARAARDRHPPPPPLNDPGAMVRTLDSFLFTIPQLIVIGHALAAAIDVGDPGD